MKNKNETLKVRRSFRVFIFTTALLGLMTACNDTPPSDDDPEEIKDYALFITVGNETTGDSYYTLTTDDLMKDTVLSPVNSGIVADFDLFWAQYYSAFYKGNFYLTVDGNVISKQHIEDGRYKESANIVTDAGSWDLGMMKTVFTTGDILNFLSWEIAYNEQENVFEKKLYIVSTNDLSVQSSNPIKFPPLGYPLYSNGKEIPLKDLQMTPTSFTIRDDKAFVGYYYDWSTEIDTAYMVVFDYPSLNNVKLLKDSRLGHVSGAWYASSSSFTDENGDYYFTTYNSKDKHYGVLRIKKGSTEIDSDYAFSLAGYDIPANGVDHHAYLKNGLAFIGSYIVDVHNQKVIKDLNSFGLGKVQINSLESYVENNNLYVFLKTDDARWFVAKYDPDTNTLTRGIEIDGGIQAVNRISRLK